LPNIASLHVLAVSMVPPSERAFDDAARRSRHARRPLHGRRVCALAPTGATNHLHYALTLVITR
jgi:hypothetical protein